MRSTDVEEARLMATVASAGSRAAWLHALRWGTFRRVWSAATVQQFGYWFSSIALQWLTAVATDHDALTLSLLYFVMLLPLLLLSLPAGVLADVRDRRHVLLSTQLAVVVISTTMAVLVFLDRAPVWALMAGGFAIGSAHAVSMPASQALVADTVPAGDLRGAVLLQTIGMNLARILGPALAGVLIVAWSGAGSLLVYGALGVVSLLVLRRPVAEERVKARQSGKGRVRAGWRHAASRPPAATALATVAVTSVFAASYLAQTPVLANLVSDDPRAFPALTSSGGVGALIGVLTVALRRPAAPSVTPAAVLLVLLSGTVMGLGASRVLWLSMLLIGTATALQFGVMTHCNAVIQQVIANTHRGRVMSLYGLCWGGLLPVGGLLLGVAWHFVGPTVALSASGCVSLAFAVYLLTRHRGRPQGPAPV
jgi:MFS family permease